MHRHEISSAVHTRKSGMWCQSRLHEAEGQRFHPRNYLVRTSANKIYTRAERAFNTFARLGYALTKTETWNQLSCTPQKPGCGAKVDYTKLRVSGSPELRGHLTPSLGTQGERQRTNASLSVRNSVSQKDPLHHIVAYTRLWQEG